MYKSNKKKEKSSAINVVFRVALIKSSLEGDWTNHLSYLLPVGNSLMPPTDATGNTRRSTRPVESHNVSWWLTKLLPSQSRVMWKTHFSLWNIFSASFYYAKIPSNGDPTIANKASMDIFFLLSTLSCKSLLWFLKTTSSNFLLLAQHSIDI